MRVASEEKWAGPCFLKNWTGLFLELWERSRKDMNLSNRKVPDVVKTPSRFRNPIGKYRLSRSKDCIACGKCVKICPYGVHKRKRGGLPPRNDIFHRTCRTL